MFVLPVFLDIYVHYLQVARGNCFLEVNSGPQAGISCVVYALKKFTGGLGDDDDKDRGDDSTWKRYFTKVSEIACQDPKLSPSKVIWELHANYAYAVAIQLNVLTVGLRLSIYWKLCGHRDFVLNAVEPHSFVNAVLRCLTMGSIK